MSPSHHPSLPNIGAQSKVTHFAHIYIINSCRLFLSLHDACVLFNIKVVFSLHLWINFIHHEDVPWTSLYTPDAESDSGLTSWGRAWRAGPVPWLGWEAAYKTSTHMDLTFLLVSGSFLRCCSIFLSQTYRSCQHPTLKMFHFWKCAQKDLVQLLPLPSHSASA